MAGEVQIFKRIFFWAYLFDNDYFIEDWGEIRAPVQPNGDLLNALCETMISFIKSLVQ